MKLARLLKQTCVYWAPGAGDGYGGKTYSQGVELPCRWEDTKRYYLNDHGVESLSNSTVFTSTEMLAGGFVFLGDLDALAAGNSSHAGESPTKEPNAYVIKNTGATPNLNATQSLYEALL